MAPRPMATPPMALPWATRPASPGWGQVPLARHPWDIHQAACRATHRTASRGRGSRGSPGWARRPAGSLPWPTHSTPTAVPCCTAPTCPRRTSRRSRPCTSRRSRPRTSRRSRSRPSPLPPGCRSPPSRPRSSRSPSPSPPPMPSTTSRSGPTSLPSVEPRPWTAAASRWSAFRPRRRRTGCASVVPWSRPRSRGPPRCVSAGSTSGAGCSVSPGRRWNTWLAPAPWTERRSRTSPKRAGGRVTWTVLRRLRKPISRHAATSPSPGSSRLSTPRAKGASSMRGSSPRRSTGRWAMG